MMGVHSSSIAGSAKVLNITSYPTPLVSPCVIATRIFLFSSIVLLFFICLMYIMLLPAFLSCFVSSFQVRIRTLLPQLCGGVHCQRRNGLQTVRPWRRLSFPRVRGQYISDDRSPSSTCILRLPPRCAYTCRRSHRVYSVASRCRASPLSVSASYCRPSDKNRCRCSAYH